MPPMTEPWPDYADIPGQATFFSFQIRWATHSFLEESEK